MAIITRSELAKIATVRLAMTPETTPHEGNASATGVPQWDARSTAWIRFELARGNPWAWCAVEVTAEYNGAVGRSTLGGCSYSGEKGFRDSEMPTMTDEALDDLHHQLEMRDPVKRLTSGVRQAITTSYRGPTDTRGSRVVARCEAKRIAVEWDDALDSASNHAAAALQLMADLGWSERNSLVMGGTRDGYVFVQVSRKGTPHV